jgi:hypothetical protein
MLMNRITLAAILFLAGDVTNAEAQFCHPGGCGYYRAAVMHRPYPFWRNSMRFAHGPAPSANGHRGWNGMPGGLGNPYTSSASGQSSTATATGSHFHRYVPGGLSNPYTTTASVGGEPHQSSSVGGQRYTEGAANPVGQGGSTGNSSSTGASYRGDGQRSGDNAGQPTNGSYSAANAGAAGNFKYSCTINDSEEDAGAACTRTSLAN